ncbi:hypothetical protein E4T42_07910 [Aureobasidium subglaciale]|nr:hypothetical protein E4T42_07910 [Aureobasidium subglaciale]
MKTSKDTPRTSSTPSGRTRQQPGLACDECRARKLRCDRQRPTCTLCESIGVECVRASTSLPRGPKKGHMRILQSKINDLERRLSETEIVCTQPALSASDPSIEHTMADVCEAPLEPITTTQCFISDTREQGLMALDQPLPPELDVGIDHFMLQTPSDVPDPAYGMLTASTINTCDSGIDLSCAPSQPFDTSTFMTTHMQADLDQMYFDRVHVFMPMLHHKRYIVRSRSHTLIDQPFDCLRKAVWMMAASVCQPQNIQDMLYIQAKTTLEVLELNSYEDLEHLEEAQAWILVAMYEMKRVSFRKGWISAGRAIRLVLLMKLHELDMPRGPFEQEIFADAQQNENTWIVTEERRRTVTEERRRTFWMVYCLDRLINLLNQVPFTISEQSILTRLPASEEDFQSGRPADTAFLLEILRGTDKQKLSAFNNLLIQVTLWGRGLLHQHRRLVDDFYGNESTEPDFYHRLQWLDGIIAQSEHIMTAHDAHDSDGLDSMLLFTNMVARSMLISLCRKTGNNHRRDTFTNIGSSNVVKGYETGTWKAITEMLKFSDGLRHYGQSNIHPFAAIPLYFCADLLRTASSDDALQSMQHQQVMLSLQELALSNVVAQSCVKRLDTSRSWADLTN